MDINGTKGSLERRSVKARRGEGVRGEEVKE